MNSGDYTVESSTLYLTLPHRPPSRLVSPNEDTQSRLLDDSAHLDVGTIHKTLSGKPRLPKRSSISLVSTKLRSHLLRPSAQLLLTKVLCSLLLLMSAPPPGQADPAVWSAHNLPLSPPAAHGLYGFLRRARSGGLGPLLLAGSAPWSQFSLFPPYDR